MPDVRAVRRRRRTMPRARRLLGEELEDRRMLAQTTGLFFNEPGASDGYVLFSPNTTNTTYLIDKDANIVNQWQSTYQPGLLAYLLPDGSLIRAAAPTGQGGNGFINAAGAGGLLERFDWDGNKVWEFSYSTSTQLAHHDFEIMPNGNILLIAWERKTEAQATQAGRDPNLPGPGYLYPDHIIEVQPDLQSGVGGEIVWQWHVWDHLVQDFDATKDNWHGPNGVQEHPELIDINYVSTFDPGAGDAQDWTHANSISYNADLDQIIVSVREFSEFWVIDHSTTTEEAAGSTGGNSSKGGNLLYRWGNPQTYGAGDDGDRVYFYQHDALWIPEGYPGAGNITVLNNGFGRPGTDYTTVEEIAPPVDANGNYQLTPGQAYGPSETVWTYVAPLENFSAIISGAERQANGNTFITYGVNGTFAEVTPDGEVVWKYVSPYYAGGVLGMEDPIPSLGIPGAGLDALRVNFVFRALHYPADYLASVFDTEAPQVAEVRVSGAAWSAAFVDQMTTAEIGDATGYPIPDGAAQDDPLPWAGVNRISLRFTENVNVAEQHLAIEGIDVAQYSVADFAYDSSTYTATWTLTAPIGNDRITLRLDGQPATGVRDVAGNLLDGDWTHGADAFPSGDGDEGGDFEFQFSVLLGDVNQDGTVDIADILVVGANWQQASPLHDPTADGVIDIADILTIGANWQSVVPSGGGGAAAALPYDEPSDTAATAAMPDVEMADVTGAAPVAAMLSVEQNEPPPSVPASIGNRQAAPLPRHLPQWIDRARAALPPIVAVGSDADAAQAARVLSIAALANEGGFATRAAAAARTALEQVATRLTAPAAISAIDRLLGNDEWETDDCDPDDESAELLAAAFHRE